MKNHKLAWVDRNFAEWCKMNSVQSVAVITKKVAQLAQENEGVRRALFGKKRGTLLDMIPVFIILVGLLITMLIVSNIGTAVIENTSFADNFNQSGVTDVWNTLHTKGFDSMFVAAYFLLHIGIIILAIALPITGIIFLAINIVFALVIGVLASIFEETMKGIFVAFNPAYFPMTGWIVSHFLVLEIGFVLILMYALYQRAKAKG